jgi:hypothetical protein
LKPDFTHPETVKIITENNRCKICLRIFGIGWQFVVDTDSTRLRRNQNLCGCVTLGLAVQTALLIIVW